MMEDIIKPTLDGLSNKYTLTGHYLCKEREYKPIYSGKAMANADLFLYQVYNGLNLEKLSERGIWFPRLYVYADQYDSIWLMLKSKRFCNKIFPLFGVNSIDELKERIEKCVYDKDCHYSNSWSSSASAILSWIKLDEVAVLP